MTSKRVLMVYFETPPSNGSSVQRYLSMYKAFVEAGCVVDVLSVHPSAYPNGNCDGGIPQQILQDNAEYIRPKAFDVQRDLAWHGRYIGAMMTPDRWGLTWGVSALLAGRGYLQRHTPDIIWSSAPIPTTHWIAGHLAKMSGAYWIADYRDPMAYLHKNVPWYQHHSQASIDRMVAKRADQITFATAECMELFETKVLNNKDQRCAVMSNGFIKENFTSAMNIDDAFSPFLKSRFNLYYAGVLYPSGRDPGPTLKAVSRWNALHQDRKIQVIFQGSDPKDLAHINLEAEGLLDSVFVLPKVSFELSLKRMLDADALLLIQGEVFNRQVPGKLYEYLFAGQRVLLATPENSASAKIAEPYSSLGVAQGDSAIEIFNALESLVGRSFDIEKRREDSMKYERTVVCKEFVDAALLACDTMKKSILCKADKDEGSV